MVRDLGWLLEVYERAVMTPYTVALVCNAVTLQQTMTHLIIEKAVERINPNAKRVSPLRKGRRHQTRNAG